MAPIESDRDFGLDKWGQFIIRRIVYPCVIVLSPLLVSILIAYFIIYGFKINIYAGIQNTASGLVPLIIMTYIYHFHKDILKYLGKINPLPSFILSVLVGFLLMGIVRLLGTRNWAPVVQIALSGSFCLLIFAYIEYREQPNKVLAYFFGIVVGFLLYITILGFPSNAFTFQE